MNKGFVEFLSTNTEIFSRKYSNNVEALAFDYPLTIN